MPLRSAYVAARSAFPEATAITSWPSRRMAGIIRVSAMSLAPTRPQRMVLALKRRLPRA